MIYKIPYKCDSFVKKVSLICEIKKKSGTLGYTKSQIHGGRYDIRTFF